MMRQTRCNGCAGIRFRTKGGSYDTLDVDVAAAARHIRHRRSLDCGRHHGRDYPGIEVGQGLAGGHVHELSVRGWRHFTLAVKERERFVR
jgi:hypothetical protein